MWGCETLSPAWWDITRKSLLSWSLYLNKSSAHVCWDTLMSAPSQQALHGCVNFSSCPPPRGWPGTLVTPHWGKRYRTVIMATVRSFPFIHLLPLWSDSPSLPPTWYQNPRWRRKLLPEALCAPCKKSNYLWSREPFFFPSPFVNDLNVQFSSRDQQHSSFILNLQS